MTNCDFCDGIRINGRVLERDPETNGWRHNTGAVNPSREDLRFACRSCAKVKINNNYGRHGLLKEE